MGCVGRRLFSLEVAEHRQFKKQSGTNLDVRERLAIESTLGLKTGRTYLEMLWELYVEEGRTHIMSCSVFKGCAGSWCKVQTRTVEEDG